MTDRVAVQKSGLFPTGGVRLDSMMDGTYVMRVAREFVYNGSIRTVVPEGFLCDGASIPRIFWRVIGGPWGPYREAAVVHDWWYRNAGLHKYDRKTIDRLFLEVMRALPAPIGGIQSRVMYMAVRAGGWHGWRREVRRNTRKESVL